MNTRDSHLSFVKLNGVRLAACAWDGYEEKGRGMVCVLSDLENEVLKQVPFDFLPELDASRLFRPWYGSKEARLVSGYDPRKEVVVCFIQKTGEDKTDIDCYKVLTRPSPPEASMA